MTREEAIKMLEYIRHVGNGESEYKNDAQAIALDIAIKALEQQPCDDCISRQALIEKATSWDKHFADSERCVSLTDIQNAPSVTPKAKMGRWIEERNDYGEITHWHCSNCYDDSGFITTCKWDYCPNCGAKMEESEEEE